MSDEPHFAEMYGASPLTPRMAARLWVVAQLAHDAFRQGQVSSATCSPTPATPTG